MKTTFIIGSRYIYFHLWPMREEVFFSWRWPTKSANNGIKEAKKNYSIAMSLLLFTLNKMKIILHSLFVGHRRGAIVKNNFPSWSHTFNRFYSTDLYYIYSDMEVCKRYQDIITLLSVKYDKWYSLSYYVFFFISDL